MGVRKPPEQLLHMYVYVCLYYVYAYKPSKLYAGDGFGEFGD